MAKYLAWPSAASWDQNWPCATSNLSLNTKWNMLNLPKMLLICCCISIYEKKSRKNVLEALDWENIKMIFWSCILKDSKSDGLSWQVFCDPKCVQIQLYNATFWRRTDTYVTHLGKVSLGKKKVWNFTLGGGSGQNWVIFTLFLFFFFHVLNHANLQRKNFFSRGGGYPLTWKSKFLGHIKEKPCNFL